MLRRVTCLPGTPLSRFVKSQFFVGGCEHSSRLRCFEDRGPGVGHLGHLKWLGLCPPRAEERKPIAAQWERCSSVASDFSKSHAKSEYADCVLFVVRSEWAPASFQFVESENNFVL